MPNTADLNGQCLCGAVTLRATDVPTSVSACHCKTCRRWGGGPFMDLECGQAVTFAGEAHITVFNSSDWAERGFCSRCGSHLFYRLKESGQHFVPVGLFDEGTVLEFTRQVFIDSKPGYYRFAEETKNLTGAEVFAMFGGSN